MIDAVHGGNPLKSISSFEKLCKARSLELIKIPSFSIQLTGISIKSVSGNTIQIWLLGSFVSADSRIPAAWVD